MCGCTDDHHGRYRESCCCGGDRFKRRFFTREEKIAMLEDYLKDLQAEMKAVEAKIKRIKEHK